MHELEPWGGHIMFRGHPYLRQERHRAEMEERERVLRLLEHWEARMRRVWPEDTMQNTREEVMREVRILRRAIQQGHQR